MTSPGTGVATGTAQAATGNTSTGAQSYTFNLNAGQAQLANSLFGGGTSGTSTAGNQYVPPSAASSAYEYETYVQGVNVVLGASLAGILGLTAGKVYQASQILQQYMASSAQVQYEIDAELQQAGMYTDNGQPMTGVVLGSSEPQNAMAMVNALIAAGNANKTAATNGVTLDDLLSQAAQQGIGTLQQKQAANPIVQGGNTYQVNLTSPDTIYSAMYQAFEQLLGRAPTQAELDKGVSTMQSEEAAYQQAQNTQAETASQAKFKASEQAASAQVQFYQEKQANSPNSPAVKPPPPTSAVAAAATKVGRGVPTAGAPGAPGAPSTTGPRAAQQAQGGGPSEPFPVTNSPLGTAPTSGMYLAGQSPAAAQQAQAGPGSMFAPGASPATAQQGQVGPPGQVVTTASGVPTLFSPGASPAAAQLGQGQVTAPPPGSGLVTNPGTQYVAPTTLTDVTPPSPTDYALTAATTGANTIPYLGEQYLQAYNSIVSAIENIGAK